MLFGYLFYHREKITMDYFTYVSNLILQLTIS